MRNIIRKTKKYLLPRSRNLRWYRKIRLTAPLDNSMVLLEQQRGLTANGNLFHIARELSSKPEFARFHVCFSVDSAKKVELLNTLHQRNLNVEIIERRSHRYYQVLATAKYLICDTSFPPELAKRPGQVLLNTWHGTPLKTLGYLIPKQTHLIGNVQKCFLTADYILYPNHYSAERFSRDYQYADISNAIELMGGYPRNAALANARTPTSDIARDTTMRTYAYLPTFRSPCGNDSIDVITNLLISIDQQLTCNEILLTQLHPIVHNVIDFNKFDHIRPFPINEELYDALAQCDALVTDYSSVMFDFAITQRKIVLFTYDEKSYLTKRGLYINLDNLPFPRVYNINELLKELRSPKQYNDSIFLDSFCSYDSPQATNNLCRRIFLHDETAMPTRKCAPAQKHALIWLRSKHTHIEVIAEAIATALIQAETHKVLLAIPAHLIRSIPQLPSMIPHHVSLFAIPAKPVFFFNEIIAQKLHAARVINNTQLEKHLQKYWNYETQRLFSSLSFDSITCL